MAELTYRKAVALLTEDLALLLEDIDEATDFAKAGEKPTEAVLMTDVWADGGSAWRN